MDIAQFVALAVGILGLVWHQQRSIDKLRAEMHQEIGSLRAEMRQEINGLRAEIGGLRAEMRSEFAQVRSEIARLDTKVDDLRTEVAANGQRLARIEGYLGIGIPETAVAAAAGARSV